MVLLLGALFFPPNINIPYLALPPDRPQQRVEHFTVVVGDKNLGKLFSREAALRLPWK